MYTRRNSLPLNRDWTLWIHQGVVLQCVAHTVLQCVTVSYSVLQCVAVCVCICVQFICIYAGTVYHGIEIELCGYPGFQIATVSRGGIA